MRAECRQRAVPLLAVVDHRQRVVLRQPQTRASGSCSFPPARRATPGTCALIYSPCGSKRSALRPRVLDAEIRRGVRPGARAPLPAAVVAGESRHRRAADEMRLALAPVDVQVLGQKHRDDHPQPVVHEAVRAKAAASRRRRWGNPCGPRTSAEVPPALRSARFQRQPARGRVELHRPARPEMVEDLQVEIAPGDLADELLHAVAPARGSSSSRQRVAAMVNLADREQPPAQVLRETRGRLRRSGIACGPRA